ncbi:MAG: tRNA lysidine(34) synthetase TilS [Candidatus Shikimatogenerans sp. JK-2022]|nr:tRNA lysidine(34) synthetase TilS [Candidatus Shikimatogenerans bostrichidophilus]
MIKKFKNYFYNKKFLNKKFLIAVSGGIDSIVLLNIFNKLFNNNNLYICNCNFNLKKNNNINNIVFNFCYKQNLFFFYKKFNTLKYIKKNKISIQIGARKLRYKWFNKIFKKYYIDYIILGHHINDNIETFYLNILNGTSLYGLKGIKTKYKNIIRPYLILNIKKKEIYNYAIKNNIKWEIDESNYKNIYLRNKVRNILIPFIKKKFKNYYYNIKNLLFKLKLEYKILKNNINKYINNFINIKKNLNFKYFFIYLNIILNIKYYEYYLYRFLIKYKFFNINILKNLPFLRNGKIIYSNNYKYLLIKCKDKLILSKTKNIFNIKKKINKISIINFNKKNKIFIKIKKKKKIKYKNNFIYLNFDLIKFPIYIINWKKGLNYIYKNKIFNINKILKNYNLNFFLKKQIFFILNKNNTILSSINKILIYNKNYLIKKNTKYVLYFNFLK